MLDGDAEGDAGREPGTSTASSDAAAERFGGDLHAWLKRVMADHELPGLAFVVAYAIGQHMNRATRTAFPGVECVGREVGRDERSVRKAVRALVSRGHLIVAKRRGGGGSTHYTMPEVNRAKSPGPPDGDATADRAKTPGPRMSRKGSERAKTPGPMDGENKADRAFSSVQSGRKRPPNHPSEPSAKRRHPSSPVPRDPGDRQAGQVASVERDPVGAGRPKVANDPERQRVDSRWLEAVGPEAAARLADDSDRTDRLWRAIAAGQFTAEDVDTAIADWKRDGEVEMRFWGFLIRWADTAAKRRAAGIRPDRSALRGELAAFAPPPPGMIELPGGLRCSEAALDAALIEFVKHNHWNEAFFCWRPDSPFNEIPVHILARHLDMVTLKNGRSVPACAARRAAEEFRAYHGREWIDIYGSKPGTPGCLLPDDLQAEALRPREPIPKREDPVHADSISARFG